MAEKTTPSAEAPRKKKNVIVLVPIVLVVLAVQTLAAYFTVSKLFFSNASPQASAMTPDSVLAEESKVKEKDKGKEKAKGKEEHQGEAGEAEKIYQFPDIIVNPAGTSGRRFLVVSMSLEVSEAKALEELKVKEPILRDALITLLAAKSFEYVSDVLNMETLRSEIMDEVNKHLTKGKVTKIYFTGYVLQ
jgi:flagellar basal body-associated protein FliL